MKFHFINENDEVVSWETPDIHRPLDQMGVMATLNVVLGIWTIEDASHVARRDPQDLINEALSWAAASVMRDS